MAMQLSTAPSLFLSVVQCFNAAAFVALSFFYFAMFCIDSPTVGPLVLVPQQALAVGVCHP